MENLQLILLSGLLISSISISGILLLKIHPRIAAFIEKNLLFLGAISAGVFLVTSSLLIRETLEILPLSSAFLAFGTGAFLYILLHHLLSPHRHLGKDHRHPAQEKKMGWKIIIGDTLHNIADGLLLVASFGASTAVGVSNALSIALHEVPQEISEFLVLKKSGFTNNEAVYRNFASALSIFIGISLGLFFIRTETLQAYLLGVTGTFFLGIIFTDLFPIRRLVKTKTFTKVFVALLIGISLMMFIQKSLGQGHSHEPISYDVSST